MSHNLRIEILLPATPAQVMQMLTEQKQIEIWSGEEAVLEAKEGGTFSMFGGWANGIIKTITPEELSYSWKTAEWPESAVDSLVRFTLKAEGEQTMVQLNHTNLPDEDQLKSHKAAWNDFFFTPLEDYLMVRFNA